MSTLSFLKEGLRNLRTTGTITRSGKALCEAAIERIDFKKARVIVELGAGDGVITRHILQRLHPDGIVLAFEVFDDLCEEMRKIDDPRLIVVNDSAENIGEHLKKVRKKWADHIVSAIPFAALPEEMGKRIVKAAKRHLRYGGQYNQVHYSLKTKDYYRDAFGNVEAKRVWRNLPPAWVLYCTHERPAKKSVPSQPQPAKRGKKSNASPPSESIMSESEKTSPQKGKPVAKSTEKPVEKKTEKPIKQEPRQAAPDPQEEIWFEDLDIADEVLDGLDDMGFTKCTPVQAQAIPPALKGKDVLAVAQTGTGKTAAFLIPIISKLTDNPVKKVNTIILTPTRELAMQIDRQLEAFSYHTPVSSIAIYGGRDGQSMVQERRALKTGAPIVVATPGRLIAHLDLGYTDLSECNHLVLDEADRMLDMGFVHDMQKIIAMLPQKGRQTLFFSATMPPKIRKFSKEILTDPVEISIAISKPAEKIDQKAYDVTERGKVKLVTQIVNDKKDLDRILIFAGTKKGVRELTTALKRKKLDVASVSSDLEQKEREDRLVAFRSGRLRIIVATDVLSRGIHIDGIDLVINYDVPGDAEDYVHRIGRTARAAAEGAAITLISPKDRHRWRRIEELIGSKIERLPLEGELEVFDPRKGGGDRDRRDDGGSRDRGGNNRNRGGKSRSSGGGRGRGGNNRRSGGGSENKRSDQPKGEGSSQPKKSNNRRRSSGSKSGAKPTGGSNS